MIGRQRVAETKRFSVWPSLIGICLSGLLVYGFWRSEFGLTSLAVVLVGLFGLMLMLVQATASAIVALILGDWRRTVSSLMGALVAILIICGSFAVPIELRFSVAAQSHYVAELARAGNPGRQAWLLDAQFLGPDQTDLVYDESDGEAPPYGLDSYVKDDGECSLYTGRLDGHFYRKSLVC